MVLRDVVLRKVCFGGLSHFSQNYAPQSLFEGTAKNRRENGVIFGPKWPKIAILGGVFWPFGLIFADSGAAFDGRAKMGLGDVVSRQDGNGSRIFCWSCRKTTSPKPIFGALAVFGEDMVPKTKAFGKIGLEDVVLRQDLSWLVD